MFGKIGPFLPSIGKTDFVRDYGKQAIIPFFNAREAGFHVSLLCKLCGLCASLSSPFPSRSVPPLFVFRSSFFTASRQPYATTAARTLYPTNEQAIKDAQAAILADPAVKILDGGAMEIDATKAKTPLVSYALMLAFGVHNTALPDCIGEDFRTHLMELEKPAPSATGTSRK